MDYTDFIVDRAQHMRSLEYELSDRHNKLSQYLNDMGILSNVPVGSIGPSEIVSASDALSAPLRSLVVGGNTVVQDGELLPVRMEGVETVGFNQWDEQWVNGRWAGSNGTFNPAFIYVACKNKIRVLPNTSYYLCINSSVTTAREIVFYDAYGNWISDSPSVYQNAVFQTPSNAGYMAFNLGNGYGTTYNNDICINISDPSRNGTYEPYWSSQRAIPVATYFPDGMRSAGTVRDELTETQAITRVGAGTVTGHGAVTVGAQNKYAQLSGVNVDRYSSSSAQPEGASWVWSDKLGRTTSSMGSSQLAIGRTWTSLYAYAPLDADDSIFDQLVGATVWYQLANPTTTPIDPPLELPNIVRPYFMLRSMLSSTSVVAPILTAQYVRDINIVLNDLQDSIADIISGQGD